MTTFTILGKANGLPELTLKTYDGEKTTLVQRAKGIKDIAIHPQNPYILAAVTSDAVYLTKDGGETWNSLGFCAQTAGAKAVAVADMPVPGKFNQDGSPLTELTVFVSHAIYGLSYIHPNQSRPVWKDITGGFDAMPTQTYPDEIADIIKSTDRKYPMGISFGVYYVEPSTKLSIEDTISYILQEKCSVSRLGDGEIKLVAGKDLGFQKDSVELKQRIINS